MCGVCKDPVIHGDGVKRGWWKDKGRMTEHLLCSTACFAVASKKATFQTERFRAAKQAMNASVPRAMSWEQRELAMKLAKRSENKVPSFWFYFPKGREAIGAFAVGRLVEAKVLPVSATRQYEQGITVIDTRIQSGDSDPPEYRDVRACISDTYLTRYIMEYTKGGPGSPSIIGKYIAVVVTSVFGDKELHNHSVFAASDIDALLEEVNSDNDVKAMGMNYAITNQTWFEGVDPLFVKFCEANPATPF